MADIFSSVIYPTKAQHQHHPTFCILSHQKDFSLSDAAHRILSGEVEYIFIVVNGQQLPSLEFQDADKFFGRRLTGAHRVYDGLFWRGKYQVFTSQSPHPSVASDLFDFYGNRALIIDLLNPKFEWEDTAEGNGKALEAMQTTVTELIRACPEQQIPQFILSGFSRGGIFAYHLAERLFSRVPIKALITVDPVLAIWKEEKCLAGWGIKNGSEWAMQWAPKIDGTRFSHDIFPILKSPRVLTYNVFQRHAFMALNAIYDKPVGSAIESALAPGPEYGVSINPEALLRQFDTSVTSHSAMLEKYAPWVFNLATTF